MLHVQEIDLREIFECAHLKFTVYGRKQARTYVNTLPQCSLASVRLAQARPNNVTASANGVTVLFGASWQRTKVLSHG